jgi:hypothetical protein
MSVHACRLGVLTVPSDVSLLSGRRLVGPGNGSTASLAGCVLQHACRYLPSQALDISRLLDLDARGVRVGAV